MRVGMAGLAALYWPICMGNGLMKHGNAEFTAAATLGENEEYIGKVLGMTAQEYAMNYGIRLYTHAEEMIEKERLLRPGSVITTAPWIVSIPTLVQASCRRRTGAVPCMVWHRPGTAVLRGRSRQGFRRIWQLYNSREPFYGLRAD